MLPSIQVVDVTIQTVKTYFSFLAQGMNLNSLNMCVHQIIRYKIYKNLTPCLNNLMNCETI